MCIRDSLELLFITLTQAGAKPSAGAPGASRAGQAEQPPAKFGSLSKDARSQAANSPEASEERFGAAPARGGKDFKLEKQGEERGAPKSRATTFIGTDPLD